MALSYLCACTLGSTNRWLDLVFQHGYFVWPFLAIRPARRLRRWAMVIAWVVLVPLLMLSLGALFFTAILDIPAVVGKRELSRELSRVSQGRYSVLLLWEETAGGAVGPHGLSVEQRMFLVPGVYLVKYVAYFEGGHEGSLSVEGPDKVRLQVPWSPSHEGVDRVYSLKRRVYF
jgi:hypothetical protein